MATKALLVLTYSFNEVLEDFFRLLDFPNLMFNFLFEIGSVIVVHIDLLKNPKGYIGREDMTWKLCLQ